MVQEAEMAGDKIVQQALERAATLEKRIEELRLGRRDLQLRLKNAIELFAHLLESDIEDERSTAVVRTMTRKPGA